MLFDSGHIFGQIAEGKALEATRMGREHRGRQYRCLDSASGDYGESNGQRTLTHTGHILYCQNSCNFFHDFFTSVYSFTLIIPLFAFHVNDYFSKNVCANPK